jgi:hypothetical protein
VVVAVVAVVVGSSAGEAVMAVADRALAEADRALAEAGGAVRAVAVPDAGSTDAGSTDAGSTCRVGSPVRAHARAADASDVSDV